MIFLNSNQADQSPASTKLILICEEDYHYVNKLDNFTAECGADGYNIFVQF